MAKLIIKDRKLCIVNNHFVTDADGAPCVCQGGFCQELPDNIKFILSGRIKLSQNVTIDPGGASERYIRESHDAVFSRTEITMSRNLLGGYSSAIDCNIPMHANATRLFISNGINGGGYGVLDRVVGVQIVVRPRDLSDPNSDCILTAIEVACTGKFRAVGNSVFDDLRVTYSGRYASLGSPVVGDHLIFGQETGNPLPGDRFIVAGANGETDNGTVFDALCTNPPDYLDERVGLETRFTETSCDPFTASIEAYTGEPICESNPFVKALKCDGSGPEITVDLRDALPDVQSSPFLDPDLYQPTGDVGAMPADTDVWIEEVCDEIEQYRVYQLCDDPDDTILVDETDKPQDALTALVGTLRYTPTPTLLIGDPVAVVWDTNACPNPGDDQLWERCRPGQSFFTPSGFLPPDRVRFVNDINSFDVAEATVASEPYEAGGNRECTDFAFVYYRRIVDDGGEYPTIGAATGVPGQCGSYQDRFIRNVCRITGGGNPGGGGGRPTDPNTPAITQPGTRSRLPIENLDGFDTDAELRRQRNGGCCGQGVR